MPQDVELVTPQQELNVGDRVKCIKEQDGNKTVINKVGTIKKIGVLHDVHVLFDEDIGGHNDCGQYEDGHCWNFDDVSCLQKIEEPISHSALKGYCVDSVICDESAFVNLLKTTEDKKMELEQVKKENIKEAKKQFEQERANAEVLFAKVQLRTATDCINDYDRQIKKLEEEKKLYQDIIKKFR